MDGMGCAGDWDPSCFRSWLQDVNDTSIYSFSTSAIPAGSYEGKVALNGSWDVNYGQGGVQNGANIAFTVPANGMDVVFQWNSTTHLSESWMRHSVRMPAFPDSIRK